MSEATKEWRLECKVYVGELGDDANREELEDVFSRYGEIKNVWIARRPAGFAFVEFNDPRDAEEAARSADGVRINGRRVKVQMSSGRTRSRGGGSGRRGYGGGGDRRGDRRGGDRSYGGGGGGYRDNYRRSPEQRRRRSRSPRYRSRSYSR